MQQSTTFDKITYAFLLVIYLVGLYLDQTDRIYFDTQYAQEDGFVENISALGLLMVTIILWTRLIKFWSSKSITWKIGVFFMGLIFLFGAGEEISWGQRILGIESNDFFLENNAQKETNLHNLVVGETKVNKLIFTQLMFLVLFVYFIIFPYLYKKKMWVQNLAIQFAVPVARTHHIVFFLAYTGLILIMGSSRRWEVLELMFAMGFFLIFYRPKNHEKIYLAN